MDGEWINMNESMGNMLVITTIRHDKDDVSQQR
jgi:hypothetical protein